MAVCNKYHVLAVDDSLVDRKLIEKILKTSSFHVTVVDSGRKALKFLGLQEIDDREEEEEISLAPELIEVNMIITDYSMPEMTGYDLLRKIKRSESLKGIPVVIMSSENIATRRSKGVLVEACEIVRCRQNQTLFPQNPMKLYPL